MDPQVPEGDAAHVRNVGLVRVSKPRNESRLPLADARDGLRRDTLVARYVPDGAPGCSLRSNAPRLCGCDLFFALGWHASPLAALKLPGEWGQLGGWQF